MLILSQDKELCVNMDNVERLIVFGGEICAIFKGIDNSEVLSAYNTDEEAKKVLKDILTAYSNGEKVYIMP